MKLKNFSQEALGLVKRGDAFLRKNGMGKFSFEAKRLLEEANLHELYDFNEVIKHSFSTKLPAEQNFKFQEFSDLPITIARGSHCFIDLYFWRRRPTTIHNHHFVGAFQCLEGNNVDCAYTFKRTQKYTKFHSVGELKLKRERLLKSGDVESIHLQDKFIHQNHHQCDLTVNLCFRTPDIPYKSLANFYYSGLKFEKPHMALSRVERLIKFSSIGQVNLSDISGFTMEDRFNFVLLTYQNPHPAIQKAKTKLVNEIKKSSRLNLDELMEKHDLELDRLIEQYE